MLESLGSSISSFYDALTVAKAIFVIADKDNLSNKKECPVMINPSSITISTSQKISPAKGTGSSGGKTEADTDKSDTKKSVVSDQTNSIETRVSMELIFDLVAQYELIKSKNSKTSGVLSGASSFIKSDNDSLKDSLIGGLNESVDSYSKIHLLNGEDFCYLAMAEACQKQNPVAFAWGPMQYTGYIEKFDSTFTYFSSAGAPLRARVKITMFSALIADAKFQDSVFVKMLNQFKSKSDEDGKASAADMREGG